jgi:hypothetical protein
MCLGSNSSATEYAKRNFRVKLSLCLTKHHAMEMYDGVDLSLYHSWPWQQMEVSAYQTPLQYILPPQIVNIDYNW